MLAIVVATSGCVAPSCITYRHRSKYTENVQLKIKESRNPVCIASKVMHHLQPVATRLTMYR